jgi:uncharacterized protein YndB with AHSA1/START domain
MQQELLENMPELATDERSIVSSRYFAAPRELVYAAFADPKHVIHWWGPRGFTTTILEMDLRAGGKWRMIMHGPDGTNYPNEMTFTEVVPMERIRLNLFGGREGAVPITLKQIITWEDEGGGTRLTFRVEFNSRDARDTNVREYGAVQGMRQLFDKLTEFLAQEVQA